MNTTRTSPRATARTSPSRRGWAGIPVTTNPVASYRDRHDPLQHNDDEMPPWMLREPLGTDRDTMYELRSRGVHVEEPPARILHMNIHGMTVLHRGLEVYMKWSALAGDNVSDDAADALERLGVVYINDIRPDGQCCITIDFSDCGRDIQFWLSRKDNVRIRAQQLVLEQQRRGLGNGKGRRRTRAFDKNRWVVAKHS